MTFSPSPWNVSLHVAGSVVRVGVVLALLDERDEVRFLLGKPVVTKHRARLRRTISERCPWARRLSWVEYWTVVARSARDEMGDGETSP